MNCVLCNKPATLIMRIEYKGDPSMKQDKGSCDECAEEMERRFGNRNDRQVKRITLQDAEKSAQKEKLRP